MARPSVGGAPREAELSFADGEVPRVDNFRGDIEGVFEREWDQVGLAVLDLVECGLFTRGRSDVGEAVVVIDGRNEKRRPRRLRVERIVEDEFRGIVRAKAIDLTGRVRLGGMNLVVRLGLERRKFLLVSFGLAGTDVSCEAGLRRKAGGFLGLAENLEVGFGARLVADFSQQEGIDVAACSDQIQIAADARLGWMNVTEVVCAVDDPEFLVSGGEIENLLILGKNDQG